MSNRCNRREFLRTAGALGSALALPSEIFAASKPSVLLFTKSSGYEHAVTKNTDGKPSVVEQALRNLGVQHGFEVTVTKDGRIFESGEFRAHRLMFFFTTGDLTKPGTDGTPPMTLKGKQALLDAVHGGLGFVGTHSATDTFHGNPDRGNTAGETQMQSEPYLQMVGGEFLAHGKIQPANLVVNDSKFPGVTSPPQNFNEEWYSLKKLVPDMHVILTLDTLEMKGEPYQRPPFPVTWARLQGKGRVFYTAMGHRPETWQNNFFLGLVAGGIAWAMGSVRAKLDRNIAKVTPGYARLPQLSPPQK